MDVVQGARPVLGADGLRCRGQMGQGSGLAIGHPSGAVWVAVHHEPENESADLQDWKRMQQRLAPIFRAHPNIAFTIILMGYHQFAAPTINPKLSMDTLYPGPGLVDVVGIDPYNWYGTLASNGEQITTFTELKTYYTKIAAWAASVGGVKWAVAETGYTDLAAQRDVSWLSRAYDDMRAAGGIALTYWDNQFNAQNSWRLNGAAKRAEFATVLARSMGLPTRPSNATGGLPSNTQPADAAKSTRSVSVKATSRRSGRVLHVNVNPNKGKGFWSFRVQKLRPDGSWRDLKQYRTKTKREVRTVNLPRGNYRVVVKAKYGYGRTTSAGVFIRR